MSVRAVDDENLPGIIEQEIASSIGHMDGTLALERQKELEYYLGQPFGNEVEGESQVVSTDVSDTVESILPSILAKFTSSDDAVVFEPQGPEDEEAAKQRTEVVNYVVNRQNNGFVLFYSWFKDACIQKNGVVKYYWEEKYETTTETYEGLTDNEFAGLTQPTDGSQVEVLKHSQQDDPIAAQRLEQMKAQFMQRAQAIGPEGIAAVEQQFAGIPIPQLHDVEVKVTKDVSKLCIVPVPPEEFGISAKHNCVSIQDAPFVYQRNKKTISYLRSMGCPEDILNELNQASEVDVSAEALTRDRFVEATWRVDTAADESTREVWVTECFFRVDYDGDGIAELRHIIMPGRRIWINEEADHINFAALTPIIMPHRWTGRSVAELVMDLQFQKSVLWRQMFNNLYLTNNPRKAVLSSAGGIVQANLDDLLNSRPGGIVREYVPNAVRNEETPFVAGAAFPMLEYLDGVKEQRTGSTRYNQGTDADSLNKTARGIALIQSAGQQRLDLIARIFAETGVKDLMRGIAYMLSKYSSRAITIKLRNKWVDIDPREWKNQFDMTVNVGLGTGNKDVQLAHLTQMGVEQKELIAAGRGYMISDQNIYNLYTKKAEAMGYKHPELFITDPQGIPPQAKQPPPNPDVIKIQAEAQADEQKRALDAWKTQNDAATEKQLEMLRQQTAYAIAQIEVASKERIALAQIQADTQIAIAKERNAQAIEGIALDAKKKDIQSAETILALKQNLDSAQEKERNQVAAENDAKVAEHANALAEQVAQPIAQVGARVDQLGQMVSSLAQQVQAGQQKKPAGPRKFSIANAQTDADGRIVGGDIVVH